jgi:hypothetical protein
LRKSKRSSASPPEFFADRCLGKGAPGLLRDGELPISTRAARFGANRAAIERLARRTTVGFFVVYEADVVRRWP